MNQEVAMNQNVAVAFYILNMCVFEFMYLTFGSPSGYGSMVQPWGHDAIIPSGYSTVIIAAMIAAGVEIIHVNGNTLPLYLHRFNHMCRPPVS